MPQPILSPQTRRIPLVAFFVLCCLVAVGWFLSPVTTAQDAPAPGQCDAVRYLIANDTVPYALDLGGGVLQPGQRVSSGFASGAYADFWTFNVRRPTNEFGTIQNATLDLRFDAVAESLNLELAVFSEMALVPDDSGIEAFQPVTANAVFTYTFRQDAVFTLVVRRADVSQQNPGEYAFTANFDGGGEIVLENLRDDSAASLLETPPQLVDGRQVVLMPGTRLETHATAPTQVASFNGNAAGVRYSVPGNNYGLLLNGWADNVYLLGGDLAASGDPGAESRRVFYLEDYGYEFNMTDGDLLNVVDSNGTRLALSWDVVRGVWITRDCAGFRLADGHTFTGVIDPDQRDVTFRGTGDNFTIRLVSFDPAGESVPYRVDLGWTGVAVDAEMMLTDGVLVAELVGERRLALDSTQIDMRRVPDAAVGAPAPNVPLAVSLADRGATLLLDWVDLRRLAITGDTLALTYINGSRDMTTRSAVDLLRVEALQNVIRIVYKDTAEGVPGEERLLLSPAEGYVEIITPAGFPAFDGRALPGEPGYSPRALNNTGGECYPVGAALPEANCAPNGHPNPANGNLWYAVTDHAAYGGLLDLTLTRSYNSAYANTGGPFGRGWTTPFLLDYNVVFDPEADSRPVTPQTLAAYPVGLDLTYAPRGLVTFITPGGSRHLFVSADDAYTGGDLVALTMPGWVLHRDNVRDPLWRLQQDTGLQYLFDRAGRLVEYGYPQTGRVVRIAYPRDTLGGPASIGTETPVIITDAAAQRRLELYYDASHHIVRSVLREIRGLDPDTVETAVCDLEAACFETRYDYTEGLLTGVTYPDGQQATYTYDESGRMIAHDDPLAPIAPQMTYTYAPDGALCINVDGLSIPGNGEELVDCNWQRVSPPVFDAEPDAATTRTVSVRGQWGDVTDYTFRLADGALKQVGDTFTLIEQQSPLAPLDPFEELPRRFEWENGLLVREPSRQPVADVGRNSVSYDYAPNGAIVRVRGGYPPFAVTYTTGAQSPVQYMPQAITYADGSGETFTYDETGELVRYTDRDGGVYTTVWDAQHRLIRVESADDATVVAYAYNALGQVSEVSRYQTGENRATWYTVRYTYDGLGRLVTVDDPLTGLYTVDYRAAVREGGAVFHDVRVTDATGAVTRSLFDGRGYLVEISLAPAGSPGEYLRRTTYTYDVLGRMTSESRWLRLADVEDALSEEPLTTRYEYRRVRSLTSLQGDDATTNLFFIGYAVDVIDPLGRTTSTIYDVLGRVREVQDTFGLIRRYNYAVRDVASVNGLRITERQARGGAVFSSTDYLFDFRWRLEGVIRDGREWRVFYDGGTSRLRGMEAPAAGIAFQAWTGYDGPHPLAVDVLQDPAIQQVNRQLAVTYDFRGRPLVATDGTGVRYAVAYCPVDAGGERTVYRRAMDAPEADADPVNLCAMPDFDAALVTDAAGRVVQVSSGNSDRAYTYTPLADGWRVDVMFTAPDTEAAWTLRYNSAGDLLQWTDSSGIVHRYEYDTLGRLVRVEVPDAPEASFTFTYNAGDLLTSQVDDLGRGTTYVYSDRGQLAVAQDVRTGNATIYGYNAAGWLASVISPLGNTTTYLYDDLGRLTGINGPTGSQQRFIWDDDSRTVTYIDPREQRTVYEFDSFGTLWRVTDAAGRVHTLDYDAAGNVTGWTQAEGAEGGPARVLDFAYPAPGTVVLSEVGSGLDWSRTLRHDPAGLLESLGLGEAGTLAFTYDPLGRLESVQVNGSRWAITHATGQPLVRLTDSAGDVLVFAADALNRLVVASGPNGTTTYDYSATRGAQVDLLVNDDAVYTFTPGDAAGNPPSIIQRTPGQRVSYLYNADGLLSEIITEACLTFDPAADLTDPLVPDDCVRTRPDQVRRTSERFLYDAAGRPIRYIDAADNIATYAYDDNGNLINFQNVQGQSFNYTYDRLNRLASISGPTGIRLVLRYNAADQVDGICQRRAGSQVDYETCVASGGELETYVYDALGRLLEQRYPNGDGETVISHSYDPAAGGLLTGWRADMGAGVALDYDSLGQVTGITTTSDAYNIAYDDAQRIIAVTPNTDFGMTSTGETYTYDEQGRLATLSAGGRTLVYRYDDMGGYHVTDANSGAGLAFTLDARGLLVGIDDITGDPLDVPAPGAAPVPDVVFEYFLNPDRRVITVQVNWANGELIELQIDRLGTTRSVAYVSSNLFVDFVGDAVGQIQRENIIGPQGFFDFESNGYIVQAGYDNDSRPLNLRVTNRTNGELIYLLSFTYDSRGRMTGETRQYGDGTQTTITYRYDNLNQLRERAVQITRSRSQNGNGLTALPGFGLPVVVVLFGMVWGMRQPERRRVAVSAMGAGLFVTLALTNGDAQTVGDSYRFVYAYDARGNLSTETLVSNETEIETLCRTYRYDTANRLTRVDALTVDSAQQETTRQQQYRYDAFNRVSSIGGDSQLIYVGKSRTLLAAFTGDAPVFYGQTTGPSGFFQSRAGQQTWLLSDGRDNILSVMVGNEVSGPVWLLDPIGRALPLSPPPVDAYPVQRCDDLSRFVSVGEDGATSDALSALRALAPPQILSNEAVWDATTNLYFIGERVYSPAIGRFLQRDPLGPDVFGAVYDYPSREYAPPVRPPAPAYATGLATLTTASALIDAAGQQSAADVWARFMPEIAAAPVAPLGADLATVADLTRDHLTQQMDFPRWLVDHYNLPGPYVEGGVVRIPADIAPGQGGQPGRFVESSAGVFNRVSPQNPYVGIAGPMARLQALTDLREQPDTSVYSYVPFGWEPSRVRLGDVWRVARPRTGEETTPSAVFAWIPRPLAAPQAANVALHAVAGALVLPERDALDWVTGAVADALPLSPSLPPASSDVWLRRWFIEDTLGTAAVLGSRWPDLPAPDVPAFDLFNDPR